MASQGSSSIALARDWCSLQEVLGAEAMRPALERLLQERFGMARGLWKNDGRGRILEGLPEQVSAGWGDCSLPWEIDDDGVPVRFDPWGGQKTGLFLDMWENRRRMAGLLWPGQSS